MTPYASLCQILTASSDFVDEASVIFYCIPRGTYGTKTDLNLMEGEYCSINTETVGLNLINHLSPRGEESGWLQSHTEYIIFMSTLSIFS